MKEGETISPTKMKQLLANHSQKMWDAEKKVFVDIPLNTRYDGTPVKIVELREVSNYKYVRAESETQKLRWVYHIKSKNLIMGAIIPLE